MICNDRRFFPYAAGGLGASPLQVQARGLVGVQGQSPLELRKSGILRYKIQPKKLNFVVQFPCTNEFKRKDYLFDVPSKANDTFAQI